MKTKILITAALFTSGFFLQSCSNNNNSSAKKETHSSMAQTDTMDMNKTDMKMDNKMMQSMNSTMTKMKDMKMTGNFDIDFADMMMMHHQAAIDMSEVEVSKGNDAMMNTMAQNIITAQKAEIEQMQQFVKNFKMPEAKMEKGEMHNELSAAMKMMMDTMMNMSISGNTDKDFAMMMIAHHQTAVTMAKDEISHGKHSQLKKMAQKIISDQTKEINDFNNWLSGNK